MAKERRSLLSSSAVIQAPWIKVTIGTFTFGVFNRTIAQAHKNSDGFFDVYNVQYPNYIESLDIIKINGQVNQYTLKINYPVKPEDDPNFFEKVFSSVSKTRKIVFSYGDSSMPTYVYKDEEAIITKINTTFNFGSNGTMGSVISYTVSATSSAALGKTGSFTFMGGTKKPSDEIKRILMNSTYGLQQLFTGITAKNINTLIAGDDKKVKLDTKVNISPLDYITYLAGCMIPAGNTVGTTSKDIYILTLHDDTSYQNAISEWENSTAAATITNANGPYLKVTRTSYAQSQSDAYEVDIGFRTRTIVTNFSIENNENYSLYYDYTNQLYPEKYVQRVNNKGEWEDVYAPVVISNNSAHKALAEDISWYTKLTQYPIKANITIQGLLRPAQLLQYLRLNVIFPGGTGDSGTRKHISSGLYIITKQQDRIDASGYRTTLSLTKISGDDPNAYN